MVVVVVVVVVLVLDCEPGANGSLRRASARVDDAVGDSFTVIAVAGGTTFIVLEEEEEEEEEAVEVEAVDDSGAGVRLLLRGVLLLRRESTMIGDLLPHSWGKKHR